MTRNAALYASVKSERVKIDYPKNLTFNTKNDERVCNIRNEVRFNKFDHKKYDPNLDLPKEKKMTQRVYNSSLDMPQDILTKKFPEYLTETGGYKGLQYKLCDVFNDYDEQDRRQKAE